MACTPRPVVRGATLVPRMSTSYVVALVVYVLLHMAFNGLLRLFAQRKTGF